jgi:hypothetical protein
MSVRLKIEVGQDAGRTWRLKDAGTYVVGRDPASALRVIDMKVSKGHCEIVVSNDGVWLRDLKSTHGTLINGQPVARDTTLKAGDEIRVGFTVLRLLSDGAADAVAAPNGPPHTTAPNGAPASAPATGAAPAASPNPGAPTNGAQGPAAGNGQGSGAPQRQPSPSLSSTAIAAPRELPPDELVGKNVAGYRVIKKIGQGGMGAVYIAEQVSLKREVALKVLSEKFVADSAFVDQFVNEARAAGALNHPNVVQVYDVGQAEGRYFFSMEFVPGGSIEDKVKTKPAEWSEALNWFLDAANALIFAGKRGILHRDVKPDNLMLAEDGSAKLCDLGLAKKSESADLMAQGIIGTPHFISPEAIRRKTDIDTRTDLYSLGCTFFRILTGQNPYPAPTVKDILLGHLNKPVPRVHEKKADVPRGLSDVVYKLMQKEPAERYANADDLYDALEKIRIEHGLEAHGIRPHSRKPLIIAGLIAVAAAAVVGYVLTRPAPVQGPDPAAEAARKKALEEARIAREGQEASDRAAYVATARTRKGELTTERAGGRITDTWRDKKKWDDLIGRFRALKDEILGHEKFGTHADLKPVAESIDEEIAQITKDLAALEKVDSRLQQEKAKRDRDVKQAVLDRASRWKAAVAERDDGSVPPWWEAAKLLAREPMKEWVASLKGKRVELDGAQYSLIADEDVDKAVGTQFSGQDWPGQDQFKKVLMEEAWKVHTTFMKHAGEKADAKTVPGYEDAATAYDAYAGQLPPHDPTAKNEIVDLVAQMRAQAVARAKAMREEAQRLQEGEWNADRATFWQLVTTLREPDRGAFWLHVFPAREPDAQRLVDVLKRKEYRALGAELIADGKALTALMAHVVTSFAAKEWADTEVEDADGKKHRITEVAVDGITWAKRKRSWPELGPSFLLTRVLHVGETPRFAFTADDLRGLAVLAELAGDQARAQSHWRAWQIKAGPTSPEAEATAMRRLKVLGLEMEAARLWLEMQDKLRWIEAIKIEIGLPDPPKPPISKTQRETILRQSEALRSAVNEAGQIKAQLDARVDLASTLWGASLRDKPHPKAGYAGEEVLGPAAPPAPVPAPAPAPAPAAPAPETPSAPNGK